MGIRTFGIVIAAALSIGMAVRAAPPVEAYGKLPALDEVHISPSGERYAFIADDGGRRRLFMVTADGKPLQVAAVDDAKVRDVEWAGDDHVLVTQTATVTLGPEFTTWKSELATVVVINVTTGNSFQVFGKGHDHKVVNAVFGSYGTAQVDGHWYGWFGARSCSTGGSGCTIISNWDDLYRVDLDTGAIQIAAHGQTDSDEWLISAAGEVAARSLYSQRTGNWEILAGRDGSQVLAAGHNDFDGAGHLHRGRTPDTMLVKLPTGESGEKSGAYSYREISLTGGPETGVAGMGYMLTPLFDAATEQWIGEVAQSDAGDITFFAPTFEARWRGTRKAFPDNIVHLVSWSADFSKLIVYTDGGDDSGTYSLVDIAKHSADPIGSAYPGVKPADVGPVGMIAWKAADGLELHGVLTLPAGRPAKSLPLVVLPHGGPEARDYPGFDWWAQAFAGRGYAVFQPNFRGSSGYGAEFRNAGLGQWGRKMQTDISDGVAELARKGIVDPKRACIVGASYGGYAALAGVTVQHGLYRCAVSVAGVADLSDMLTFDYRRHDAPSASMRYWRAFMGVPSGSTSGVLAPIILDMLADSADAPVLLIHGRNDTVVPIEQSQTMERALRHAGKPVEMVVMDNEDHWLSREATRIEMLKSTVAFVEKYDPPN